MQTIARAMGALVLGAAMAIGPAAFGDEIKLKFAHVYPKDSIFDKAIERASAEIEKTTEGRYGLAVFPASSLGSEEAINDALALGSIDMIYTGPAFMAQSVPEVSISDYPYVFRDFDHWKAFWQSDLLKGMMEKYTAATGNIFVASTYYGEREVTSNKPILKPDDMKGLKIRVPNAPAYLMFPKAVGANPTPMAFAEVYLGLQQGAVDAQENPLPTIQSAQFYEVQSDISLTGHITATLVTLMSGDTAAKIPEADRKAIDTALRNAAEWCTGEVRNNEAALVDFFKGKGVKVHEVDRQPFIDAVKPYLTDYKSVPWDAKTYDAVQALGG